MPATQFARQPNNDHTLILYKLLVECVVTGYLEYIIHVFSIVYNIQYKYFLYSFCNVISHRGSPNVEFIFILVIEFTSILGDSTYINERGGRTWI